MGMILTASFIGKAANAAACACRHTVASGVIAATTAGFVILFCAPAAGRTWTMADGRRSLEANFVSLDDDAVSLKTPANEVVTVRLTELSTLDKNLAERLGASPAQAVVVEVEASGLTPADALRNAFLAAVHRANGARVTGRTVVENDAVVEDTVLVFSDGFVADYKKLSSRLAAGLCHERIKATVQRRDISEKMSATERARDASHLYAEAFTKVQRHRVAMAVLQDALDGFNADLLDVTLAGRDKTEVLADDLDHVSVQCDLRVRIDIDRYRELHDRLLAALGALARTKGSLSARTVSLKPTDATAAPIISQLQKQFLNPTPTSRIEYSTLFSLDNAKPSTGGPDSNDAAKRDSDSTVFYVCVPPAAGSGMPSSKTCTWRWFEIDGHPLMPAQSITTVMRLTSDSGATVLEDRVSFGGRTPGLSASGRGKKLRTVIVSPFFLYHVSNGYFVADIPHAREITIAKKLRVPLETLAKVTGESVLAVGSRLDREADFPPDIADVDRATAAAHGPRSGRGVERFSVDGGIMEVQSTVRNGSVSIVVTARGFRGDAGPLSEWITSRDFRNVIEQRVRAAAAAGGSWRVEFGPIRVGKDVITVELKASRQ
jgi:hypothetical protein